MSINADNNDMSDDLERAPLLAKSKVVTINPDVESAHFSAAGDVSVGITHSNQEDIALAIQQVHSAMGELQRQLLVPSMAAFRKHRRARISPLITNNLLLISVFWQLLTIGVLTLIDSVILKNQHEKSSPSLDASIGVMITFELAHLVLVVVVSVKLSKQVLHRTVGAMFLIQSYLSTVLLFAGLYTLIFRMEPSSWSNVAKAGSDVYDPGYIAFAFAKMFFFSVSTQTSTGLTPVAPVALYADGLVCVQMLSSVLYNTTILAKGLSSLGGLSIKPPKSNKSSTSATSAQLDTSLSATDALTATNYDTLTANTNNVTTTQSRRSYSAANLAY